MPDPIRAGDPPTPLPSQVLAGQGIAAFVLTPADLDHLPTLSSYPPEPDEELIAQAPPLHVADVRDDEDRFAEELLVDLRRLGDEYGPLGVAIAAATLTDPRVLVAQISSEPSPPRQEPSSAEVVDLYRDGDACPNPACSKLAHRGPCSEDMPDLDEDPRRPRLDWYPDDGVTLSYAELRQLLALHLDRCPGAPDLARAMRDGESPLHLAEVIDR